MVTKTIKILSVFVVFGVLVFITTNLFAEVKVAVIDSGSTEQFYQSFSFSSIPANVDPIGHGTKVASLIKQGNPQAKIYILQVCEEINGRYLPSPESVLKAIEWCIENDIDIVNLSLTIHYNMEIEKAIKRAYLNKGIIFVAAAGNKNISNQFAVNPDGFVYLSKASEKLSFPASCKYVISVDAIDTKGSISNYSTSKADVFSKGNYYGLSGTSFACARITAKTSKILSSNPNISLEQLKQAVIK